MGSSIPSTGRPQAGHGHALRRGRRCPSPFPGCGTPQHARKHLPRSRHFASLGRCTCDSTMPMSYAPLRPYGRATLTFGGMPWSLRPNGDVWFWIHQALNLKGVNAARLSWSRGHATEEQVQCGEVDVYDARANDFADALAKEGRARHPGPTAAIADRAGGTCPQLLPPSRAGPSLPGCSSPVSSSSRHVCRRGGPGSQSSTAQPALCVHPGSLPRPRPTGNKRGWNPASLRPLSASSAASALPLACLLCGPGCGLGLPRSRGPFPPRRSALREPLGWSLFASFTVHGGAAALAAAGAWQQRGPSQPRPGYRTLVRYFATQVRRLVLAHGSSHLRQCFRPWPGRASAIPGLSCVGITGGQPRHLRTARAVPLPASQPLAPPAARPPSTRCPPSGGTRPPSMAPSPSRHSRFDGRGCVSLGARHGPGRRACSRGPRSLPQPRRPPVTVR